MDLMDRMDALIEERHLLTHPFYRAWLDGTLPFGAMQEYARQYYAFESTFPRFLSALHSRSERAETRAALLENLWDEEHGEANHREMWLRFGEGVGVERDDVMAATHNDATKGLLETYWTSVTERPVPAGVAAVYAYERQVPQVAAAKIDGLKHRYGVTDRRTLGFFETHALLDIEHSNAERQIIAGAGDGEEQGVLDATGAALEAWWSFLDAVTP